MTRRASKVDDTQPDIVQAQRDAGASVLSLAAIGKGCPDLLVAHGSPARMYLLEVKNRAGKNKVNKAQQDWHAAWLTTVHVVYDADDALRAIGATA